MRHVVKLLDFPQEDIKHAVNSSPNYTLAAKLLSEKWQERVTPQEVRAWVYRLDDKELASADTQARSAVAKRTMQVENNRLRANLRDALDSLGTVDALYDAIHTVIEGLAERPPVEFKSYMGGQAGTPMTVEVLLSDLQIGKLGPGYNTPVAKRRLYEFTRAVKFQIEQKASVGYRIEEIVLSIIGDIIESDKKHKNSARATDTGTAEQIADATKCLFELVIEPLARLGIPLRVICVTGNHDWDDHGIAMFKPGREHLSFPIYRILEMLTQRSGYRNASFNIPDGSYAIETIYGQHVLYEHGVGVSADENAMKAHKIKRAEVEKKYLTYFRMGDKHTVTSFNSGQFVVNGAFFGAGPGGEEYSGIKGYSSVAAQWMGFHVPREDQRLTLYDAFTIQLSHIS